MEASQNFVSHCYEWVCPILLLARLEIYSDEWFPTSLAPEHASPQKSLQPLARFLSGFISLHLFLKSSAERISAKMGLPIKYGSPHYLKLFLKVRQVRLLVPP